MSWNGSGVFTRTDGTRTGSTTWTKAKNASVKILSVDHDTHDQDLADGIQACLAKNGENSMTANLNMGTNKFSNYGNGDGGVCEKIDSDVFTAHLYDDDSVQLGSGEYSLRDSWSQTIGDIVYFTVKMTFGTITTSLNTDGIYLDITNSGKAATFPFVGDTPTNFYWPCLVEGSGALNMATTGRVESDGVVIRVNLQKLTGDPAIKSNIGTAPTSGATLFVTGWYKIADDAHVLP
jgi:hypothetical protein